MTVQVGFGVVNFFCCFVLVDVPVDKVVDFGICCVSVCTHLLTVWINLVRVLVVCGVQWGLVGVCGVLLVVCSGTVRFTMFDSSPVSDWASDYDLLDPGYAKDPYPIWDDLRSRCPIAHTDRYEGSWMPIRFEDVYRIAHDPVTFPSGAGVTATPAYGVDGKPMPAFGIPPINADAPLHTWTRKLVLSWFTPHQVSLYEGLTRDFCDELIDGFIDSGRVDLAADYARKIPVRVIAEILGIPPEMSDTFTDWVRGVLESGHDPVRRQQAVLGFVGFFQGAVAERRVSPSDDFVSMLVHARVDGEPIEDRLVLGMSILLLIGAIDTTWSALGSALWHLASHPDDLHRLVNEPELLDTAVEEFLRAYSPLTMARTLTQDVDYEGCPMKAGERVILNFPAANRDPEVFPDADKVLIDRKENRHIAFGTGIHRCAGSNLARMEMRIAIETFIKRIPRFELENPETVEWAIGQVRGPRQAIARF